MFKKLFCITATFIIGGLFCLPLFAQVTFTNVADRAGINDINEGRGVAFGDYNNDGYVDIYVNSGGLYRSNGDGTFTFVTEAAGVGGGGNSHGVAFGDYNNDGQLDIYVAANSGASLLYRNNGDGTFTDVAQNAGVDNPDGGVGVAFGDYDNDGFLDIYVANRQGNNALYRNNGDETFTDVTMEAGVSGDNRSSEAVTFGDYNDDGYLDLFVTQDVGNVLYRNNGNGTFTDVVQEANVARRSHGYQVAFVDYDNDGDLDLSADGVLYRNNGNGVFADVTGEAGIGGYMSTWGDYDNDGYLDVYAGNRLYHNNGDGTFADVTEESGVGIESGKGTASGDYNNDGYLDILKVMNGARDILYSNDSGENNWLIIKMVGTRSNRDGIGAKVTVVSGALSQLRVVSGGSGWSQDSLPVEFGLGQHTQADMVKIRWPSGIVQILENVPANRIITVEEGEEFSITGGSISGTVTADAGDSPVSGVLIRAIALDTGRFGGIARTESDGSFKIIGLEAKSYRVQAEPRNVNFLGEYFDDAANPDNATPVSVTEGEDTPNINFSLATGGSISGVVRAQSNNVAISGLLMTAYDAATGERVASAKTEDVGTYRIVGLTTGSYTLQASDRSSDFAMEYFDNVIDAAQATFVNVVQGEETPNIDFKLILNIGSISGFITSNGAPVPRIDVQIYDSYGSHITTVSTKGDGSYTVWDLRGGEYRVFVNASDSEFVSEYFDDVDFIKGLDKATAVVVVAGKETSNINFDLVIGGTISGKVTKDADGSPVPRVNVHLFDARSGNHLRTVQTRFSGEYKFEGLPTGDYKVQVEGVAELLGEFYQDATSFEDAIAIKVKSGEDTTDIDVGLATPAERGYITEWLLLGPIATERDSVRAVYTDALKSAGGETQITPSEGDVFGMGAEQLQWTVHRLSLSGDNLGEIYEYDKIATVYMAVYLRFPKPDAVDLWLGSDDTLSVWLNGRNVWRNHGERGLSLDEDQIQVDVREGWNLLLMKVSNTGGGDWAASVRFPQATILERSFTNQVSSGGMAFSTHFSPGLHIVSLPLNPPVPLTARSLAEKLGATLVVEYDESTQKFFAFLPSIATTEGFTLRGSFGYIVNIPEAADVTFTGQPWTNAAPPPLGPQAPTKRGLGGVPSINAQGCWAFAVGGVINPSSHRDFAEPLTVRVANLRTGASSTAFVGSAGKGRYTTAFLDLAQTNVVQVHDIIQLTVQDATETIVAGPIQQEVQVQDIRNAFLLVNPQLGEVIPVITRLCQNYPNPFNPETWIPYELAEAAEVTLDIYNVNGRLVRSLRLGKKPAGMYVDKSRAIHWDGFSESGERVGSGLYFYRLHTDHFTAVRKMVVLK